jgi:dephospho-CoA kinase
MAHFDSDRCVHELLAEDDATREAIVDAFGPEICGVDLRPDRGKLRALVFGDESRRKTLEGILHPGVRARWKEAAAQANATNAWLLVDIPLLYETGAQAEFSRVIVVAASHETQMRRMVQERGLGPELAEQIIAAQWPLGKKMQQADHVIWNDSTVLNLDGQTRLLANWLRRRFA